MKISDIKDEYFQHMLNHAKGLKSCADDIKAFHNIDASKELESAFLTEEKLEEMRQNDVELSDIEWQEWWKIIENTEKWIAIERIQSAKYNAECEELNTEHPIQFDTDGYAYRQFIDYEGRPYRQYVGMGN